jgi:hypothetical protein
VLLLFVSLSRPFRSFFFFHPSVTFPVFGVFSGYPTARTTDYTENTERH